ncbi:MAG: response regulator [Rhizobium sp.]|nr:response regulator [Rhizobium sp.]
MAEKRKRAGAPRAPPPKDEAAPAAAHRPLRRQAEERLRTRAGPAPADIDNLAPGEARRLLHELQVHQVELEMQNEELRDAQLALDLERARYFDLYDLAPVGYCTLSRQGQITQANLTAATLLGTTRRELIGQRWARYLDKRDADAFHLGLQKLIESGEPQSCEFRLARADGAPRWVQWSATASPAADGSPELRAVFSDSTERVRDQARLREAKEAADRANRAKSEFLSSMSHELRTPLNAVLGFAQLLKSGPPPPTPVQEGNLDYILKAGWYLLALVDEILDLAAIESGKLPLAMEPVSLAEVMGECQAMVEQQARSHGIDVALPATPPPGFVHADRKRLKQVLSNLLSNAIKYNRPDGSVVVDWAQTGEGRIRISVADTGKGLSEDELQHLFQPFNRLGKEAGREQGTGIGLVVSKRLVESMGGAIGVRSTVGQGSVFWIELSPASSLPHATGPVPAPAPAPARSGAPPRTLLCVEDNPANLALVEAIVSRRPDLRLLTATDGERGIEIARAALPDVILMDLDLPGISGTEAMRVLAEDPATAGVPVVALSADAIAANISLALAAGFFRYVTKPIKVMALLETLDAALEASGPGASRTTAREQP